MMFVSDIKEILVFYMAHKFFRVHCYILLFHDNILLSRHNINFDW